MGCGARRARRTGLVSAERARARLCHRDGHRAAGRAAHLRNRFLQECDGLGPLPLAREYARAAIEREHEAILAGEEPPGASGRIDLLLVSHVLGELDDAGWAELRGELGRARTAILVEPGSKDVSRALTGLREEMAETFVAVAPCPHEGACGAMAPGAESHWCHFFARPPQEAFSQRRWSLFARRLGIDLRSLPYAYLLLERRSALHATRLEGLARLLGRPRVEKGRAQLFVCEAPGLSYGRFLERHDRAFFKSLRAPLEPSLVELTREGERIVAVVPRLPSLERPPEASIALTAGDVAELEDGRALVFDGLLGEARARAIAAELAARPDASGAGGAGEGDVDPRIRGDSTTSLERETDGPLADLWRVFDGLRAELEQRASLTLDDACEIELARYLPGRTNARHLDTSGDGARRRVSLLYYLNDWQLGDGGELCVHESGGARNIDPELDRLVLFLSDRVEHEVLPVVAPRSAVVAWFLGS